MDEELIKYISGLWIDVSELGTLLNHDYFTEIDLLKLVNENRIELAYLVFNEFIFMMRVEKIEEFDKLIKAFRDMLRFNSPSEVNDMIKKIQAFNICNNSELFDYYFTRGDETIIKAMHNNNTFMIVDLFMKYYRRGDDETFFANPLSSLLKLHFGHLLFLSKSGFNDVRLLKYIDRVHIITQKPLFDIIHTIYSEIYKINDKYDEYKQLLEEFYKKNEL